MTRPASRRAAALALATATIAPAALHAQGAPVEQGAPNAAFEPAFPEQARAPETRSGVELAIETLAEGLEHPWGIAVTPDGAILVTERPGRLRVVQDGGLREAPVAGLPEVRNEKQGGLLDVAVGPGFAEDRMIYWTYAKPTGEGRSATAAARGRLAEDFSQLTEVEDVFVQAPPAPEPMHYGSRIVFDGEGHAFVALGERLTEANRQRAQTLDNTYGKTVRIELDGAPAEGNPFAGREGALPTIWSYGHRNIQGADVHPDTGELWVIEHGPKGGDEVNRVEPGADYGWPKVSYGVNYDGSPVGSGEPRAPGVVEPRYYWDPVIAPGGAAFYEGEMFPDWRGDLLIAGLQAQALVRLDLDGDVVVGEEWLMRGEHGRIRDVALTGDGAVLVITDAADGALLRLTPRGEDS